MTPTYARNLIGYGGAPPHANWPGNARVAISFVLNYEEGGERCVLHGDRESEAFLSELPGATPLAGVRHMSMESVYEYGSRAGVWRVLRLFEKAQVPLTIFAVAMAIERHPELARALVALGHEICSHGDRWIDYQHMSLDDERRAMREAMNTIERVCVVRPRGWYTGRTSPNTRKLVMEDGSFQYDSDAYDDDLPYWVPNTETAFDAGHLVIPYTLDTNDMRFATAQGFNSGTQFFDYLRDAFDVLYAEGATAPKMMSVGLHARIIGRPARLASLERFLGYATSHDGVWCCRRIDIANHWREHFPYVPPAGAAKGK